MQNKQQKQQQETIHKPNPPKNKQHPANNHHAANNNERHTTHNNKQQPTDNTQHGICAAGSPSQANRLSWRDRHWATFPGEIPHVPRSSRRLGAVSPWSRRQRGTLHAEFGCAGSSSMMRERVGTRSLPSFRTRRGHSPRFLAILGYIHSCNNLNIRLSMSNSRYYIVYFNYFSNFLIKSS